MDFLPQMSPEYFDQGYFESGNFSMHEYSRQIELNLKANINIGAINRWRPPQRKSSIGDLSKT
jgi:hypothetical protein